MGNCSITIHAVGSHHNHDHPHDINKMAARFVDELKAAGHSVTHAHIHHGGAEDLLPESGGPTRSGVFGALAAAAIAVIGAITVLHPVSTRAADLAVKPLKAAADLSTAIPCLTTGCTGFYGGFHAEGGGSSADIIGSGLNGSIFDGGAGLGAQLGYQLWNGSIFAAAEVGGTWYTGQGNIVTSLTNVDPRWSVDYLVKFGYGLANLFNSPPANTPANGSVIQALAQMLTSPYFGVGGRTRNFGSGLEMVGGLQYAIGAGWNANAEYFHVEYDSTQQMAGLPPVKIASEQGVRLQVNKLFSF